MTANRIRVAEHELMALPGENAPDRIPRLLLLPAALAGAASDHLLGWAAELRPNKPIEWKATPGRSIHDAATAKVTLDGFAERTLECVSPNEAIKHPTLGPLLGKLRENIGEGDDLRLIALSKIRTEITKSYPDATIDVEDGRLITLSSSSIPKRNVERASRPTPRKRQFDIGVWI
jgi:hypothetical protein